MEDLTIGGYVRTARLAKGLSQQTLATQAGIALRTLSRIEAGEDMNVRTLEALADALGLPASELLSAESTEKAS